MRAYQSWKVRRSEHALRTPVKVLLPAIVIPGADAEQGAILLKQYRHRLKVPQKVRREQHVVLDNDHMTVLTLNERPIQTPFVMLR